MFSFTFKIILQGCNLGRFDAQLFPTPKSIAYNIYIPNVEGYWIIVWDIPTKNSEFSFFEKHCLKY